MKCTVTGIYWERILLHFDIRTDMPVSSAEFFLTEEVSGCRYPLRLSDDWSGGCNGVFSCFINVTNAGTCRCLPDGTYRITAAEDDGAPIRADAVCKAEGTERIFPFNGGKDCCRILINLSPLYIQVKTEYARRRHRFRTMLMHRAADVAYQIEYAVSHADKKGRRKKRVLFLSGQSETPGGNLTAVRNRMKKRGLTGENGGFEILESYRDRRSGRKSRLKALRKIASADYIFLDDHEPIFDTLILKDSTVLTQLWHGGVGFKSSGYSRWGHPGCPAPFSCHRQYTWGIVSSRAVIPIYSEIWGINDSQVLPLGLPKMDRFLNPEHRARAEEYLKELFPMIREKKVILFAPTYRGRGKQDASYPYEKIDFDLLYDTIGDDAVVLFRMHPWVRDMVPIPGRMRDRMADAGRVRDINDLFYITDLLITDYSSNICEYSLMSRPMLFYAFDEKEYSEDRGFHRDYKEYAPGKVCYSFSELMEAYKTGDYEQERALRYVQEQFDYRDSGAADRVIDRILLGKETGVHI